MKIGNIKQKAHPILSVFVMVCSIVTVGLLYVVQKAEVTAERLDQTAVYHEYLDS